MKKYCLILFLFLSVRLFAQFDYIDQSELYIKNNVKEINSFFHQDSLLENGELWKIDSKGRIVYNELLPNENDSSYSVKIWYFENNLLSTYKNIGVWNIKTNKLDTATIEYVYDSSKNLVRELLTNTKDNDTLIWAYEYLNDLRIMVKLYNKSQSWWYKKDTIEYYDNKIPKLKIRTHFYNNLLELSINQYYDTLGIIQTEVVSDYSSKPIRIKTFIYDNNKLIRIKEVSLGYGYSETVSSSETIYEYNENRFLIKCLRFRNNKYLNHDTYEYK